MMQQGLRYFTETPMTVIGMCLFLAVYVGVIVWTFSGRRKHELMLNIAQMPLREED